MLNQLRLAEGKNVRSLDKLFVLISYSFYQFCLYALNRYIFVPFVSFSVPVYKIQLVDYTIIDCVAYI